MMLILNIITLSTTQNHSNCAPNLAKEGRYSLALCSLGSLGCASLDDEGFQELVGRHPIHNLPSLSDDITPSLFVDSAAILAALKMFPNGSSPGASRLWAQHLIDAILTYHFS